jgi:hypothetical protein
MIEVPGVVTLQESRGSARTPGGDVLAFLYLPRHQRRCKRKKT